MEKINIGTKADIAQLGLDPGRFVTKVRGKEWAGPCPRCVGKDRFILSNGQFWCRQCHYAGTYEMLAGVPMTLEERSRISTERFAEQQAERERSRMEQQERLAKLNETGWKQFHDNLLESPSLLGDLAAQGIPMRAVKHFKLGYIPSFRFFDGEMHRDAPGFTFPIFSLENREALVNMRVRLLAEGLESGKYRPFFTGLGAQFFLADFYPESRDLIIVEGEKKAIVLWSNGLPAIGLWGVDVFKDEWASWIKKRYRKVWVMLDNEQDNESVQRATERIAGLVGGHIIRLPGKPDDMIIEGLLSIPEIIGAMVSTLGE